jgi:hypothetical protein
MSRWPDVARVLCGTQRSSMNTNSLWSNQANRRRDSPGVSIGSCALTTHTPNASRGVRHLVVLTFSCEWVAGEPCAAEECVDSGWFSLEQALGLVEAPQQKAKLLEASHPEAGPRYRCYRTRP